MRIITNLVTNAVTTSAADAVTDVDPAKRSARQAACARRLLVGLFVGCLAGFGFGEPGAAEDSEQRFLAGLRARRLFDLAERHCRARLESADLTPREEVDLTVERIRNRAEQAVHARPDEREPHWRAAREIATEFLARQGSHPRALLVRVQDALTPLARGRLARQESEVTADPTKLQEAARTQLREAVRLLEAIDKDLAQQIARAASQRDDGASLTSGELFSLQHHVHYQLGRAHRNRALCYPPGSANWLATLSAATEQLARPLSQLTPDDDLWWSIRLDQIACHRLLKEYPQADRLLRELLAAGPPIDIRWQAVAEGARLRLAAGQPDAGLAILTRSEQTPDGGTSDAPADVDLARLECLLALWESTDKQGNREQAERWQQQAAGQVAAIEQRHGPFWGRRAELLLVRRAGRGSANLEILERTAANFYRKGQLEEAIDAYDQASARAAENGQVDAAFALSYKAALIEQQAEHHAEAGRRLREIALRWPRQPDAGKAHLLSAWNTAQTARTEPNRIDDYRRVLQEHLAEWAGTPTAAQAAQWLGALHESSRQWQEAADAYAQAPPGTPQSEAALVGAIRCWKRWLEQLEAEGQPVEKPARQVIARLEGWVLGDDGRAPERWSQLARRAALEAAGLLLQYPADGHARAEQLLRAATEGPPAPSEAWKSAADGLRIVAIAGQPGRAAEAQGLAARLGGGDPQRLLEMLQGLDRIANGSPRGGSREVARLQLELLRQLGPQRQRLPDTTQRELDQVQARALLAAGDPRQAGETLRQLAERRPRDVEIQLAYGRYLLQGERAEQWEAATEQWRRLAAGSKKYSERWWEARYAIAESLLKQGKAEEATRRIEYLLATAKFDSADRRRPFESLLKRCRVALGASSAAP